MQKPHSLDTAWIVWLTQSAISFSGAFEDFFALQWKRYKKAGSKQNNKAGRLRRASDGSLFAGLNGHQWTAPQRLSLPLKSGKTKQRKVKGLQLKGLAGAI